MSQRKEVFQSKVIQKLYPAPPTVDSKHDPPCIVESTQVKEKTRKKATLEKTKSGANAGRPVYTVLPPPPDYNPHSEMSSTILHLEGVQSPQDTAVENFQEKSDESEEEKEIKEQTKRRKRKKKSNHINCEKARMVVSESIPLTQASANDGSEHLSKNKRRKLKKKRHKEKMFSMGLTPQAAALEFIYQKDGAQDEEEDKEDNKKRAAELSDFLRTTLEIYMSDSSQHPGIIPHLPITMDNLLDSIECGRNPDSVLKELCSLKTFAQRNEIHNLEKALDELTDHPSMSSEETTAVISLFKYWITDILPRQEDRTF